MKQGVPILWPLYKVQKDIGQEMPQSHIGKSNKVINIDYG